jgi:hypothetical protein
MSKCESWTEKKISSYLARVVFRRRHLVMVPNCMYPGNECDLLVVTQNLRMIDVEIKISRSDFKVDSKKDKWFHRWDYEVDGPYYQGCSQNRRRRDWPARVWKHYYCVPKAIWKTELYDSMNAASGLLLIQDRVDGILVTCERRAKPDRGADILSAENVLDIARLANLRMWDAYEKVWNYERRVDA